MVPPLRSRKQLADVLTDFIVKVTGFHNQVGR
jgi:hypothetical protein